MLLLMFPHLAYFIQYVDMKGLANDNVNGSPMGKDRNDAVERDLKAMLRTDLLALRELAANMSKGIIW